MVFLYAQARPRLGAFFIVARKKTISYPMDLSSSMAGRASFKGIFQRYYASGLVVDYYGDKRGSLRF